MPLLGSGPRASSPILGTTLTVNKLLLSLFGCMIVLGNYTAGELLILLLIEGFTSLLVILAIEMISV